MNIYPWNKGMRNVYKLSEEHKRKISISLQGRKVSIRTRKKISMGHKGKKLSEEHKKKLSIAHKGRFTGEDSSRWTGGRHKTTNGYIRIFNREHPFADSQGYIYEHRLVMEQKIGRYLLRTEIVHHINEIKDDNRKENLKLIKNDVIHRKERHNTRIKHGRYVNT